MSCFYLYTGRTQLLFSICFLGARGKLAESLANHAPLERSNRPRVADLFRALRSLSFGRFVKRAASRTPGTRQARRAAPGRPFLEERDAPYPGEDGACPSWACRAGRTSAVAIAPPERSN